MSIKDLLEKGKPFYILILGLVLASIFFALGRLSALEERHTPIKILSPDQNQTAALILGFSTTTPMSDIGGSRISNSGEVIGSKTGKKYYFPWCGTVKRLKPENQVHFASVDLARQAGYVAGGNCKGLK